MADETEYPTVADRVRALEAQFGGTFERTPRADGQIVARLVSPNGDAIAGVGATTKDAVANLAVRVKAFAAALAEG
jgi:hypothetical protein